MKEYIFERNSTVEDFVSLVKKDNILKEMANLSIEKTGLDHGTIYISSEEGHHGPRIKYYRGKPGKNITSASISISKNPEVKEDSLNLKASEKNELFKFVILNKKRLLYMWNHGMEMIDDEWDKHKRSLKRI